MALIPMISFRVKFAFQCILFLNGMPLESTRDAKGTYDTLADEASSSMFDESKWTPSRLKSLETFSRVPRIHVH